MYQASLPWTPPARRSAPTTQPPRLCAVLESIRSIVLASGGTMTDVTFNMIFLKDMSDYQKMNAVYKEFFPSEQPARYCIRADLVKPEFLVEISSIAHIPE